MKNFLKKIKILSSLSDKEISAIEKIAIKNKYKKNEYIFKEGATADKICIILKGVVQVLTKDKFNKRKAFSLLKKGDVIGEMALFNENYRCADVIAIENTEVIIIKNKIFKNLILNNSKLCWKILKVLSKRLKEANEHIRDLTFYNLEARIVKLLINLIKPYGKAKKNSICLDINLTHNNIADIVGSSRETITKILTKFKKEKSIDIKNKKIIILDMEKLKQWCN